MEKSSIISSMTKGDTVLNKRKSRENKESLPKSKRLKLLNGNKDLVQKTSINEKYKVFHKNRKYVDKRKLHKLKKASNASKNHRKNKCTEHKKTQDIAKSNEKWKPLKPKKLKLFEMKKKDRKKARQQNESKMYELGMKAKQLWENLRREDCPAKNRYQLLKELVTLVRGHVKELIFAHDTVRVVECLVALGTEEYRTMLFDELKDCILPIAKSKYAKFFLLKILKYGKKEEKDYILKCFHGQVLKLIRHTEAAAVIEFAYNEYANATQRAELIQEFYGPHYAVFKDNAKSLAEVFSNDTSKKASILTFMKESLLRIVEKSVIRHSIVHYALKEFMTHADPEFQTEVIEAIRDVVVEMLHTKDGSRVAMNCMWHGTAKDRKVIIKSLKSHVKKIAKEEFGHMMLLAVFDSADDTILVKKIIIKELVMSIHELSQHLHGRKVLLYLLCPRDPHFFHNDVVNILRHGDKSITKKKSCDVRQMELRKFISPPLLKLIEEYAQELLANNSTCLLMVAVLIHAEGDFTHSVKAIAQFLSQPYISSKETALHPIEHKGTTFLLKKLIMNDRNEQRQVKAYFSEVLVKLLPDGIMSTWYDCNRGAFILLSLLESGIDSVEARVKQELKGHHKVLAKKPYKGAQLLLKKLKAMK